MYFVVGLLLGASLVGLGLTPLVIVADLVLPPGLRVALAVAVLVAVGGVHGMGRGADLWQNRRLVPQAIVHEKSRYGALQFGFEMGTGVRTFVTSALPLALVSMVLILGSSAFSALVATAGFGLGRAILVPLRGSSPDRWDRDLSDQKAWFGGLLVVGFLGIGAAMILQHV